MTGFYVFLAVAGAICITLSFLLSEKLEGKKAYEIPELPEEVVSTLLEKNSHVAEQMISSYTEKAKENAVEDTTIALNRLTNEKIMAVDEFSDTVLEKISQNHSEVIFLYNMLNEKEKELKEMLSGINQASNKTTASTTKEAVRTDKPQAQQDKPVMQKNERSPKGKAVKKPDMQSVPGLSAQEKKKEAHTREEILSKFEKGMTITDIAQELQMGKGEIKLIIDLYQGAR